MVKAICWILFLFFLLLLTKNIVFKKSPQYYKNYFRREYKHYKVKEGWEQANTKPFSTIRLFYYSKRMRTDYKQNNLLGNVIGFIPFGFLLPLLMRWFRRLPRTLFAGFILSLGYEMMQLLFGLGIFDVDDLILNMTGCFIGYLLFLMIRSFVLAQEKKKIPV